MEKQWSLEHGADDGTEFPFVRVQVCGDHYLLSVLGKRPIRVKTEKELCMTLITWTREVRRKNKK